MRLGSKPAPLALASCCPGTWNEASLSVREVLLGACWPAMAMKGSAVLCLVTARRVRDGAKTAKIIKTQLGSGSPSVWFADGNLSARSCCMHGIGAGRGA